jgi:hypothetical protein
MQDPLEVKLMNAVLQPSENKLAPVGGVVLSPAHIPFYLRELFAGKTGWQAAEELGVDAVQFAKVLAGQWKPTKTMLRLLNLREVYATVEPKSPPDARARF